MRIASTTGASPIASTRSVWIAEWSWDGSVAAGVFLMMSRIHAQMNHPALRYDRLIPLRCSVPPFPDDSVDGGAQRRSPGPRAGAGGAGRVVPTILVSALRLRPAARAHGA